MIYCLLSRTVLPIMYSTILHGGWWMPMDIQEFSKRLAELRIAKGVSARDMSLSIGQATGYINNIENCKNFPSMTQFFYICDYLGITPKQFFDTDINSAKQNELLDAVSGISSEQLDTLIALAKGLKR